tara:strand:- start:7169 stop:8458 length:1290 start_codon:yes stop_codon:yes gene_type:complete
MKPMMNRRQASQALVATGTLSLAQGDWLVGREATREKLPVAAAISVYHRFSHADVILGKLLEGWLQKGGPGPGLELVSVYVDQFHENDLARALSRKYGFRIARTIDEAVTLGQDHVPVAGVLSIAEHGRYPVTADTKQQQYPRRRFFDEIVAAMQRVKQYVPIFNDKHLGYRWGDAAHMVKTARQLQIPLMAGSSLPVTWRYPAVELPAGEEVKDALVVGHSTSESYLFHALEALQCTVERRRGGETGIKAVRALKGAEIFAAEKRGEWSRDLLKAALRTLDASTAGLDGQIDQDSTVFFLIEYADGMTATAAMMQSAVGPMPPLYSCQLAIAVRRAAVPEPLACWMKTPGIPFRHFGQLLRGIEVMLRTGKAVYPVERTLLTTGLLDRMLQSLHVQQGSRLETPELAIRYHSTDWGFANRKKGLGAQD